MYIHNSKYRIIIYIETLTRNFFIIKKSNVNTYNYTNYCLSITFGATIKSLFLTEG